MPHWIVSVFPILSFMVGIIALGTLGFWGYRTQMSKASETFWMDTSIPIPDALRHNQEVNHAPAPAAGPPQRQSLSKRVLTTEQHSSSVSSRIVIQIVISIALLGAALFIILSERYDSNSKHWAFATVGTILGFWLKA